MTIRNLMTGRRAYSAVILAGLTGFGFAVLAGEPGPFTLICAVGGFAHMASVAILQRRR